jgi:hypothetical protein
MLLVSGKADISLECAHSGGHLAGLELTKAVGLSEDESHGQAPLSRARVLIALQLGAIKQRAVFGRPFYYFDLL